MKALILALFILLCWLVIAWRGRQRGTKQNPDGSQPSIGWDQVGGGDVAVPNKAKEEWHIREATFLYQTRGLGADPCYLEANYIPQPKGTKSAFSKLIAPPAPPPPPVVIALPDDFMKRIAEKGHNLKRSSECEVTAHGVVDKETGQKGGYIFTVSDIYWISPTDVEVSGGLWVGSMAGTSKTYYLKKVGGEWQIVGEHLKSISCG